MARVLLAEDEAGVRAFVQRALEGAGHSVTAVTDGAEAARCIEEAGGDAYDLLVSDIVMPVMDGIALALRTARDAPETRIILMTGFAEQRERAHGLDAIVDHIMTKPFPLEELTAAVAWVLDGKREGEEL